MKTLPEINRVRSQELGNEEWLESQNHNFMIYTFSLRYFALNLFFWRFSKSTMIVIK